MKGIRRAFYAIIALALIISVCGCTDQKVVNNAIQPTNAPSERPAASVASELKRSRNEQTTFSLADDGPSEHGHADAFYPAHHWNELHVHPRNA
jgi:uncharacterized lipoprotein YehR (DUF1307 family)